MCRGTRTCDIGIQTRSLGIPVVCLANSYMVFRERLLCNRRRNIRYGIEQITTSRKTSAKYRNTVHLHSKRSAFLSPPAPTLILRNFPLTRSCRMSGHKRFCRNADAVSIAGLVI